MKGNVVKYTVQKVKINFIPSATPLPIKFCRIPHDYISIVNNKLSIV